MVDVFAVNAVRVKEGRTTTISSVSKREARAAIAARPERGRASISSRRAIREDSRPLLFPPADASAIPTWYLAQFSRQHVKVALSGDGGDESFAGYQHYAIMQRLALFDWLPQTLRGAGAGILRFPQRCFPWSEQALKLDKALGMVGATLSQRYHQYLGILKDQEKDRLYTSKFHDLIRASRGDQDTWEIPWASTTDQLDWMMAHDQTHYLPDCLMVKTDIASKANSLEVRCPLLDHELVEFACSLPSSWKINAEGQKVISSTPYNLCSHVRFCRSQKQASRFPSPSGLEPTYLVYSRTSC